MRTEITHAELASYADHGFLVIPDFLEPDEVDELESAVKELLAEQLAEAGIDALPYYGAPVSAGSNLSHHMNPFQRSPRLRKFSTDCRLADITHQLEGVEDIRLYQDMIAVKPPWGAPTAFHMDVPRISFTSDHAVSYWFPLVDVTQDNACLYYLPGAHKEKRAAFGGVYEMHELDQVDPTWATMTAIAAAPVPRGGVVLHEGYAPHGTNANMSPRPRPVFVITHMPDGVTFDGTPNLVRPGDMPVGTPLTDDDRFPVVRRATTAPSS